MVHGKTKLHHEGVEGDHARSITAYHSLHTIERVVALHPSLALQTLAQDRQEVGRALGPVPEPGVHLGHTKGATPARVCARWGPGRLGGRAGGGGCVPTQCENRLPHTVSGLAAACLCLVLACRP